MHEQKWRGIVYDAERHRCVPPDHDDYDTGTIWRCTECRAQHWLRFETDLWRPHLDEFARGWKPISRRKTLRLLRRLRTPSS